MCARITSSSPSNSSPLRSDHLAEPRTREEAGFTREGVLRTLRSSMPAPDAIWR
jgi:hypothetical protein